MINPIVACDMFATPTSAQLMDQIESLPAGTKSTVMIYVMMALNMASKSVDAAIEADATSAESFNTP